MRRPELLLSLCAIVVIMACGAPLSPSPAPRSGDAAPRQDVVEAEIIDEDPMTPPTPLAPSDRDLPASLTCVSSASRSDGETWPGVYRVHAEIEGDVATVEVLRGPQFRLHGEGWDDDQRVGEPRSARVSTLDGLRIAEEGPYGLTLELERRGAFFFGTLVDEQRHLRAEVGLTCWDPAEVFGATLTGEPTALVARFDWGTGRCLDIEGDEALNELPVEFVRETGFGECADLRGARLNGDDYAYPRLSGWHLAGAVLDGAELFFAHLDNATLHGARLGGLAYGYATLTGTISDATTLPAGGCEVTEGSWGGSVVECSQ